MIQDSGTERNLVGLSAGAVLLAVLSLIWFQGTLLGTRTFDPDEFQHAHSAYSISRGQLPYVDYFDHHPPLFHAVLSPLVRSLEADRDADHALRALFALRCVSWMIALMGLLAHHVLARRLLGPLGAAIASLLLASTVVVFEKTMEIRPDTFAFVALQTALLVLSGAGSMRRLAMGFSILGVGLLLTPKLVFPLLGVMVSVWLHRKGSRFPVSLLMLASLAWPALLCAFYFLTRGAFGLFLEDNVFINLRWKARLAAWPFFVSRFAEPNPFFAGLGVLSLLGGVASWPFPDPARRSPAERMVLLSALLGICGLVALPVAWEQYYLLFLPQFAIVASATLLRLCAALLRVSASSARVALAALMVCAAGLWPSVEPLRQQALRTDLRKEQAIRMVMENLSPDEPVLDGYSGIGVFRPHAFHYFFLHAEVRQMLSGAAIAELASGLRAGDSPPHFASADSHLAAVSPQVATILKEEFELVEGGPVMTRLFPGGEEAWDDTRPRLLGQPVPRSGAYVLCGEGWSGRETAGAASFRRSKGKTSVLVFPVLEPSALGSLRLVARAGAEVSGLSAVVTLNELEVGVVDLGPSFRAHELRIPAGLLRRGLNRLEFSYPKRPAQIDPALAARGNEALALASIELDAR